MLGPDGLSFLVLSFTKQTISYIALFNEHSPDITRKLKPNEVQQATMENLKRNATGTFSEEEVHPAKVPKIQEVLDEELSHENSENPMGTIETSDSERIESQEEEPITVEKLKMEIRNMREMILLVQRENSLAKEMNQLLFDKISTGPSVKREHRLPDPGKFSQGADELDRFFVELDMRFRAQPSRFATEQAKIDYAVSLMDIPALPLGIDFVKECAEATPSKTFTDLKEMLELRFKHINQKQYAISRLTAMKQGIRSVEQFVQAFRRWAVPSGFNDIALSHFFLNALDADVQKEVRRDWDEYETLEEQYKFATQTGQRLDLENRAKLKTKGDGFKRHPEPKGDSNSLKNVSRTTPSGPKNHGATTTNQSAQFNGKKRDKGNRNCFTCNQPGHIAKDCPNKGTSKSSYTVANIQTEAVKVLPVLTDVVISGRSVKALLDGGSGLSIIDKDFAREIGLRLEPEPTPIVLKTADNRDIGRSEGALWTGEIEVMVRGEYCRLSLRAIDSCAHPIILGRDWMQEHKVKVDYGRGEFDMTTSRSAAKNPASTQNVKKGVKEPARKRIKSGKNCRRRTSEQKESPVLVGYVDINELLTENEIRAAGLTQKKVAVAIPSHYKQYESVFSADEAARLPEHRPFDMKIQLVEGKTPPYGPLYPLSDSERAELRAQLKEALEKGFIRPSTSSAGAPILFVKKKDGSLRLCVDYRGLNAITVKDRYPIPLISQLMDDLKGARIFTKIDLRGAYNLVRVAEGDEWKTAFRTHYGQYEYLVMPFGLTNAPAVFQRLMQEVLRKEIGEFAVVYLDDILIYSKTEEEHIQHVSTILERLQNNGLYAKLEKCEFHVKETLFLGVILSPDGLQMDPAKVEAVQSWEAPKTVKGLQRFIGFTNFYRKFIPGFSKLMQPLTALLKGRVHSKKGKRSRGDSNQPNDEVGKKGLLGDSNQRRSGGHKRKAPTSDAGDETLNSESERHGKSKKTLLPWTDKHTEAFETIKAAFLSDVTLVFPDGRKQFILETDASDFALGGVLSQKDEEGNLRPVAFHSRKLNPAEQNYEIYDKELLAIVDCLQTWRSYLIGPAQPTLILTDHRNLEYFMTMKQLNQRQARWSLKLADYDFVIVYRPGKEAVKPDALSRRDEHLVTERERQENAKVLLPPERFLVSTIESSVRGSSLYDVERLRRLLREDEFFRACLEHPDENYEISHGILRSTKGRIYVPKAMRAEIIGNHHASKIGGHFGVRKTIDLVRRGFIWPAMNTDIREYLRACDICKRTKMPRSRKQGLLRPLPLPTDSWRNVSLDFIVDLPPCQGSDSLLVVVDRRTKMAHFIPCQKTVTAAEAANLYVREVFRLHGMPSSIVSDRGPQFVSRFWKRFWELLGTNVTLSTAYHPETDGQTERVNQVVEQYLRAFVNYQQDDWAKLLPFAEFAYNNSVHSSTNLSPFFANYGFNPAIDFVPTTESCVPTAESIVQKFRTLNLFLTQQLSKSQEDMKRFADRKRMDIEYSVGEWVYLSRSDLKTTRPCKKLDFTYIGPFEISAKINANAYRLRLPASYKIHNVFNVSKLLPAVRNRFTPETPVPPPPVLMDDNEEYEVAEILDSRLQRNRLQYFIHWKGYDESERTWEDASLCQNCPDLVEAFHRRYPSKPKATRRRRGVMSGASQ